MPPSRRTRTLAATAALLTAAAALTPAPAQADTPQETIDKAKKLASWALPNANNWSCKPTAARPHPVVLVHSAGSFGALNWRFTAEKLTQDGHCVFSLDYPNSSGPMDVSAGYLKTFIDGVREATRPAGGAAPKVAIVGHSIGGLIPRYYMRHLGGASAVAELVTMGTAHNCFKEQAVMGQDAQANDIHGPSAAWQSNCQQNGVNRDPLPPLCVQLRFEGSSFLNSVNTPYTVEPGVDYTALFAREDVVASASLYEADPNPENPDEIRNTAVMQLAGPSAQVTNELHCDPDLSHGAEPWNTNMVEMTKKALTTPGPMPADYVPPYCPPATPAPTPS